MIALAVILALTIQQPDSQSMAPDTAVVLEGALDSQPTLVRGPRLIYPQDLFLSGRQGLVIVQFVLDTTGRAEAQTLRVIQTPHMGFNLAANAYVRDAVFTPAFFQGRKVRALMQFPVVFKIGRR